MQVSQVRAAGGSGNPDSATGSALRPGELPGWAAPDGSAAHIYLAALPSAPSWARRHARMTLSGWDISRESTETAELLVSELVTNAVRFATDPSGILPYRNSSDAAYVSMMLRYSPGLLVIEVSDQNMNVPAVWDGDLASEDGRGLMLVQALSKEWSYFFPRFGWKTVYCVISI
jgi:anti-sigma regulatory factor (Ser/Thr protein kinase)